MKNPLQINRQADDYELPQDAVVRVIKECKADGRNDAYILDMVAFHLYAKGCAEGKK